MLLTVDTELTWRHYAAGADWAENLALSYDAAGAGVPYQLEVLRAHGLKACFFVDPMPALVYGIEPIRRMVAPILEAGQEVQLHLHSFWRDLAEGRIDDARFELTDFDLKGQRILLETARGLLIEAGAPPPTAFRSGSYAANADTLKALRRMGIRMDSSHNGCEPGKNGLPLDPDQIDPVVLNGVTELPVSQIRQADGGLRHLQVCAISSQEMIAALCHAAQYRHRIVTIVSHSFELATRDGKRANKLVRGRFNRLCAFLAAHRALLPTAHLRGLKPGAPAGTARPLEAARLRTARRVVEQAWGTARYEKPALGAAMLAVPPIAALEEIVTLAGL
ncbi:MAG TPA: polysaccharide deacetylase [Allosphingosinicella sp.]|nr:polysaccharide deacetylase [Allosphingosinicella sp.]